MPLGESNFFRRAVPAKTYMTKSIRRQIRSDSTDTVENKTLFSNQLKANFMCSILQSQNFLSR